MSRESPASAMHSRAGRHVLVPVVAAATLVIGVGVGYAIRSVTGLAASWPGHSEVGGVATPKTLYTCGMHPEVIRDEPGLCPKCEMKLTPMDKDRAAMILAARGEQPAGGGERKILYWRAPMDPSYIRNEPGKSPMGMDLVPVYEDEVAAGPSIKIDPVTEQNMGVRYDIVRRGPIEKVVRTVGTVDYDEQSLGTVTTKVDGWVERLHVDETGVQVHRGDPLFEIYSRELFSAQEEYLTALRDLKYAESERRESGLELAHMLVRSARGRLRLFDISEDQIEQVAKDGEPKKTLTIRTQATGIVTQRNVTEGDFLKAGQMAYRIADLSNVWVMGKVYESDVPFLSLGQEALMRLDYLPGRTYRGRVTYIYPYLEKGTREIPVRMEFHNPGYELKPGMYATIELRSRVSDDALLVPATAVIDTGVRQVAFVQREAGKFEPRQVETGFVSEGASLQVLRGLAQGERVVISGQFLLDSESRLREATLKMLRPGMHNASEALTTESRINPAAETSRNATSGRTEPLRYVCPMPGHAGILYDEAGDCPLCGMKLVPIRPGQQEGQAIDHYTCPMPEHYHVHTDGPGKCPECSMTLIPVMESDEDRFANVSDPERPPALYTCPMPAHADVVSDRLGTCSKCGMELVPVEGVVHGKQAAEHWRMTHGDADEQSNETPAAKPILFTCPMASHADVVSDQQGRCPKCNMKMVPTTDVKHGKQAEDAWSRRKNDR